MLADLKEIIKASDMVLVGLGEEFNDISYLKNNTDYERGRQWIEEEELYWLLPAYGRKCLRNLPVRQAELKEALNNLATILQDKNYFVVSTSTNDLIREIPWKAERLVMPCGGSLSKQCSEACAEMLQELTTDENVIIEEFFNENLYKSNLRKNMFILGQCPKCNKPYILNNIYAEHYDESGYLVQWQLYTKWLQGSLNKKLLILELGVGMKFPSVIRWPFEKIAFFNQKASFYRVNENLYQMSEELKDKGISISKNAIDWLRGM